MAKFCTKCGAPIAEGVKFCPKCGATIGQIQAAQPTAPPQQPPVQQQPMPQQQQPVYQQQPPMQPHQPYYGQTQPYAPMPGKSNKKLIIGVLVAVVAIVVVLLLVFFVLGGEEGKFVGTWEVESTTTESPYGSDTTEGDGTKITFNSDGTTKTTSPGGYSSTGKWELKNGKLCNPEYSSSDSESYYGECADYEFSDGGNTLTITYSYSPYEGVSYKTSMVLKKV